MGKILRIPVSYQKHYMRRQSDCFDQINASAELNDLKIPPGNKLEALKHDRKGQYSIRINDQWRICFTWKNDGAHGVEVVDYH